MNFLRVTEIDHQRIKQNFKEFLRTQDKFKDYDFEGSDLSVLLELLAYQTHYDAVYANAIASERFIDTAQKRDNLVSIVKNLGYTPNSLKSATALVDVTVSAGGVGNPDTLILSRNTPFQTTIDSISYTFFTVDDTKAILTNSQYKFEDVLIKQGITRQYSFVVGSDTANKFTIPDAGIDLSSLKVFVLESQTDNTTQAFSLAGSLLEITDESPVYWIYSTDKLCYQLQFGDGVIGQKLETGNIVFCEYLISSGKAGNAAKSFRCGTSIGGFTSISTTTVQNSYGGDERESIEEIRFNAPMAHQAQNRAVTSDDYTFIIRKNFSNIGDVRVWGGEDNNPPEFGKVFISISTENDGVLTDAQQSEILDTLVNKFGILSMKPVFVEPTKTYIGIHTEVFYDRSKQISEVGQIQTGVENKIKEYSNLVLEKFGRKFRQSILSSQIDDLSISINSTQVDLTLINRIIPTIGVSKRYTSYFNNELELGSVSLTGFTTLDTINIPPTTGTYKIIDDRAGVLKIYKTVAGIDYLLNGNAGTVDYVSGVVDISDINITSITNASFDFIPLVVVPKEQDIQSKNDQVLIVDESLIVVEMTPESSIA